MKLKAFAATFALITAQSVFAQGMPQACPEISALRNTGVSSVVTFGTAWAGLERSYFGTADEWAFVIGTFAAKDDADALAQANAALNTLSFMEGPVRMNDDEDKWVCAYQGQTQEIMGIALTPISDADNLPSYKKYLHR